MKALRLIVCLLGAVTAGTGSAFGNERRIGIGTVNAITQFPDVSHHRISYTHPWTKRDSAPAWHPDMLRISFGLLWRNGESARLYSVGPVWRWDAAKLPCNCRFEAGISPSFLSDPIFHHPRSGEVQSLGYRFQFVTHGTLVWVLDRDETWELAIGLQHISNSGMGHVNPGADFLGVDLFRRF